jgi:hypothetical protein
MCPPIWTSAGANSFRQRRAPSHLLVSDARQPTRGKPGRREGWAKLRRAALPNSNPQVNPVPHPARARGLLGENLGRGRGVGPKLGALWVGRAADLTLTEFRIVRLLAQKAGQDVGYREIYDLVHGKDLIAGNGSEGYRANVRTFIKRIRKKFRDVDPGFDHIQNYASFGYRWIAEN